MKAHSRQILSVQDVFGEHGWHGELIEGADVIRSVFEAHHTQVEVFSQAYVPMNALAISGETPADIPESHFATAMELFMRANKQLNLGNLEYDLDRKIVVFRITNAFDREVYDKDIVSSMVHTAIAESDRFVPYLMTVLQTRAELLPDLSVERLLMREDFIPPVPEGEEEEL